MKPRSQGNSSQGMTIGEQIELSPANVMRAIGMKGQDSKFKWKGD
jgi:hypothetical protein